MRLENIFYTIGIIFILAAVIYFTREFIVNLTDPIKLVLLIIATVAVFILAELFRGKDK